jgi:hypothetical protein
MITTTINKRYFTFKGAIYRRAYNNGKRTYKPKKLSVIETKHKGYLNEYAFLDGAYYNYEEALEQLNEITETEFLELLFEFYKLN